MHQIKYLIIITFASLSLNLTGQEKKISFRVLSSANDFHQTPYEGSVLGLWQHYHLDQIKTQYAHILYNNNDNSSLRSPLAFDFILAIPFKNNPNFSILTGYSTQRQGATKNGTIEHDEQTSEVLTLNTISSANYFTLGMEWENLLKEINPKNSLYFFGNIRFGLCFNSSVVVNGQWHKSTYSWDSGDFEYDSHYARINAQSATDKSHYGTTAIGLKLNRETKIGNVQLLASIKAIGFTTNLYNTHNIMPEIGLGYVWK